MGCYNLVGTCLHIVFIMTARVQKKKGVSCFKVEVSTLKMFIFYFFNIIRLFAPLIF
jgi:hypothetical protein